MWPTNDQPTNNVTKQSTAIRPQVSVRMVHRCNRKYARLTIQWVRKTNLSTFFLYRDGTWTIQCVPKKVALIILNRNHWKLHRTHWHPFEHCVLNCKWVEFRDHDIIICFQQHTKNAIFQKKTISVKSNEQSAKQSRLGLHGVQNVHRQRSHTLTVEYATENHAVLIKWKVRQCWRQSEKYWRQ